MNKEDVYFEFHNLSKEDKNEILSRIVIDTNISENEKHSILLSNILRLSNNTMKLIAIDIIERLPNDDKLECFNCCNSVRNSLKKFIETFVC